MTDSAALRRVGASAFVLAALVATGTAAGQEEQAPALEEIQVTGTRITRTGMTTPTPVTAVTATELRMMAPGQLIEALDMLPQFLDNSRPDTAFNFAGTAGASNLNMRGIGSNRTLVLLDGRRVVSSSRLGTSDINLFPRGMLRGVEVVTGGASAAYGSDAVAGTTNFLLDTEFTGIEGNLQGGITDRGDNENWQASLAVGTPIGDRLHLLASFDYDSANRIEGYQGRDWFNSWGTVTNPAWVAAGCVPDVPCEAGPQLLRRPNVTSTQYTFGGLINQPGSALHRLRFDSDGTATPFVLGDPAVVGTGTQSQSGGVGDDLQADRGGEGGLTPDNERYSVFTYLEGQINDDFSVFVQGMHGYNQVNFNGFTALQFGPWGATVFQDNAYLPDAVRQTMIDEDLDAFGFARLASTADLGRARVELVNKSNSATAGFRGQLGDNWRINGYAQFGRTDSATSMINFTRVDRLSLAMDAVRDPASGAIVCNVTLHDPTHACVPINLFGEGNASRQAVEWATEGTKVVDARVEQTFTEIAVDGMVHEGWGAGPIDMAFGASFRRDTLDQVVIDATAGQYTDLNGDPIAVPFNDPPNGIRGIPPGFAGNPSGFMFSGGVDPIGGGFNVTEVFTEFMVPMFAGGNGQRVDLNLAGRYADYSGSGGIWAYKAGLDFQLTEDFRLRGTLSRDTRAATLSERFDAQGQGASAMDPERGGAFYEFGQLIGGNPEVNPEEADTLTVGLVYQPGWLDGFSMAVDWYDIDLSGSIGQLGTQRIIDDCFAGATALCEQITRADPSPDDIAQGFPGPITQVANVFLNIDAARVSGVDVETRYVHQGNLLFSNRPETLGLRVLGSWLLENSITNLGAPKVDRVRTTGQGNFPDWRMTSNLTYNVGSFGAFLQHRWINTGRRTTGYVEGVNIDDNRVASATYVDMRLSYTWDRPNGSYELYGNVTNLFDRDPPMVGDHFPFFGSTHTNETLFDFLGRRYHAGVRFRFE